MKKTAGAVISGMLAVILLLGTAVMPARAAPITYDGWLADLDGNLLTDSAGYYVLTISPDMVTGDTVRLNFNRYARLFLNSFQNVSNADASFKMKIVNNSGHKLTFSDYEFTTENMLPRTNNLFSATVGELTESAAFGRAFGSAYTAMLPTITSPYIRTDLCLPVKCFDGKNINLMIAPMRCVNDALLDFYSLDETYDINLPQMMRRDGNLAAAGYSSYADYLRKFYKTSSLYDLPRETAYNILGTTRDAQTGVTNWKDNSTAGKPIPATETGLLTNDFKIWGIVYMNTDPASKGAYPYRPHYFMMETDAEVIAFAYDYLYKDGLRFSFDQTKRPFDLTDSEEGRGGDFGIKAYYNKTPGATANVNAVFGGLTLENGESFALDHVTGGYYAPNAWNQHRMVDYGFSLTFTLKEPVPATTKPAGTTRPGGLPNTSDTMPVALVAAAAGFLGVLLAIQLVVYYKKKK